MSLRTWVFGGLDRPSERVGPPDRRWGREGGHPRREAIGGRRVWALSQGLGRNARPSRRDAGQRPERSPPEFPLSLVVSDPFGRVVVLLDRRWLAERDIRAFRLAFRGGPRMTGLIDHPINEGAGPISSQPTLIPIGGQRPQRSSLAPDGGQGPLVFAESPAGCLRGPKQARRYRKRLGLELDRPLAWDLRRLPVNR